jgi:hypothetical protein
MGQGQEPDHGAARPLLAPARQQRLDGTPVSATRKELLAIDQSLPRRRPGFRSAIGLRRKAWTTCR